MEQREQRGHMVYPIFFHVDPSDFRHQRNYVEKAFKEHEGKYDNEKTQSWRLALEQVTAISGWPLKDQHESKFVDGIVKQISEKLNAQILNEQEVIKMKRNYQKIQAVLEIAEDKLYMKEGKVIKVWFDELKDMAYDIGDVLDEWKTAILKSKIEIDQAQIPSTSLSLSIKVHNIPSTISLFGGIAFKIKELNKKLEATRVTDYLPLAVDPNSCNDQRLETQEKKPRLERLKTTSLIDELDVCGRDHDKNALTQLLLNDNNGEGGSKGNGIPLIAIVGMGGSGKTTLAQLAFNNDEMKKHFPQRIWVCVSDPFDEVRIAKAILESLTGCRSSFNELESLLSEIHHNIKGKKFLLVLDDVWTGDENKWKPLKLSLSSGSKESKILVTTRNEKVSMILGCTNPFLLKLLSYEDSWSLFSKIAFFGMSKEDCVNLESIGRQFVKNCGGLPLAIKTLASLLQFKRTKEQWQRILESEMWKLEDQIFEKLYAPLLLSYIDLPNSARQCFRYCAIFPKDHQIERDILIKLWMSQGFLGEGDDLEMMGEECFDNLAVRGFFQEFRKDGSDGSIIGCKMHDIVHDFAQFLTKTECLLVASCDGIEEQRQAEICHENVRHLTTIGTDYCSRFIDGIMGVDKLRSFLLGGTISFKQLNAYLPELFDQLINLRMLSIRCGGYSSCGDTMLEIPRKIGELIHLRYLSFEGNEKLYELPEALCDLCNLQTLNIRGCFHLIRLPHGMEKLINLRHLLNRGTDPFSIMPKGMERLTCLQTLERVLIVDRRLSSDSLGLVDLGNLMHLRGDLHVSFWNYMADASEAREAPLSIMPRLRSLTLNFFRNHHVDKEEQKRKEDFEIFLIQPLHPPPHLQILNINNHASPMFPNGITSLTSLKSVSLYGCCLPPLGRLPYLEFLSINHIDNVKKVGEEFLGIETSSYVSHIDFAFFPTLKELEFHSMGGWEEWEYEYEKQLLLRSRGGGEGHHSFDYPNIMPKLQCLAIHRCPKLKTLPHHLLQSRALQRLDISYSEILYKRFNKKKGHEWPSISHIPRVEIW